MELSIENFFFGRFRSKLALYERGELLLPSSLEPCHLKILMVVDGTPGTEFNISFNHAYFGLSAVLDTLRENPEFFVRFDVTRAHRQKDSFTPNPVTEPELYARYAPHFEGFRFTQDGFKIDDYDQVWLFGIRADNTKEPDCKERLTDAELEVLAGWMNRGGGLFAVGDHDELGSSLCARVPRASTMRRWTNAQGVPPEKGINRNDTLIKGHDNIYTFDDESDDVPMPITPRFRLLRSWNPFRFNRAPHEILCGTDGVINILPDHPHEGALFEDAEVVLNRKISFGAIVNEDEYPTVDGTQPRPEIIADAHVQADHDASGFGGVVNPKTFGVISVYNGHQANVGRVVVDSTWHHWFDVNLTGRPTGKLDSPPLSNENPKTYGFLATSEGMVALARIQNYFRNVAIWLASPAKQRDMFLRATWGSILRYPLVEEIRIGMPTWSLGESVRADIGRRVGQCMLRSWIMDLFPFELRDVIEEQPFSDGELCLNCPPFELVEIYFLGGATRELWTLAHSLNAENKINKVAVTEPFVRGAVAGISEMIAALDSSLIRSGEFSRKWEELSKGAFSEAQFLES